MRRLVRERPSGAKTMQLKRAGRENVTQYALHALWRAGRICTTGVIMLVPVITTSVMRLPALHR